MVGEALGSGTEWSTRRTRDHARKGNGPKSANRARASVHVGNMFQIGTQRISWETKRIWRTKETARAAREMRRAYK